MDALNEGIVDWLGGLEETLTNIDEFKLVKKAQPGVTGKAAFAQLKEEMWRETISYLDDTSEESIREDRRALRVEKERAQREKKIAEWEGKEKATL